MAQPYVGEIRLVGFNFEPVGWLFCEGQLLPISEFEVLFNLIGTTYGGDGENTFALPDLRGRVPIHQGSGVLIGELGGVEEVALTVNQIPAHNHHIQVDGSPGTSSNPAGNVLASTPLAFGYAYGQPTNLTPMADGTVANAGGSQPHENMQPFLVMNYIISAFGIFPSQG